jgi:hypothetical protein
MMQIRVWPGFMLVEIADQLGNVNSFPCLSKILARQFAGILFTFSLGDPLSPTKNYASLLSLPPQGDDLEAQASFRC